MTRAHISPDGYTIRYVQDGAVAPAGWSDLPVEDTRPEPVDGETLDGPTVVVEDGAVRRVWTARAKTTDELWAEVRVRRDALLSASDLASGATWADRWAALPSDVREAWSAYRQALRDLPDTYAATGPASVVWPTPPA